MTYYMLKHRTVAPYYGIYAQRDTAVSKLRAMNLEQRGYTVVRVRVTEAAAHRARYHQRPDADGRPDGSTPSPVAAPKRRRRIAEQGRSEAMVPSPRGGAEEGTA